MTFRYNFYAEQAYLAFVKDSIENPFSDFNKRLERGAICVVITACSLEAIVNSLLKDFTTLSKYERLPIKKKIEQLLTYAKLPIQWHKKPLDDINSLIQLRNWLVHFKDSDIGLISSSGIWIEDDLNKLPVFDPDEELDSKNIKRYYDAVRKFIIPLSVALNAGDIYQYLQIEEYDAFLIG